MHPPDAGSRRSAPGPEPDRLQVSLEDTELLDEMQMTIDLIIAANDATAPLDQQSIDGLLGL